MRSVLVAATLALLAVTAVHAAGSCPNGLVAVVQANYNILRNVTFLTTPADAPTTTVCPSLSGKSACCTSAQFNFLESTYKAWYNAIDSAVATLNKFVLPAKPDISKYYPSADNTQKQIFVSFVDDLWALLNTFVKAFISSAGTCAKGELKIVAGAYCFLCDAQWESYFAVSNGQFTVAKATCTSLVNDCQPLFTLIVNLIQSIRARTNKFATDYIATIPNVSPALQATIVSAIDSAWGHVISDPCNGDCTSLICNHLVNGFEANVPEIPTIGSISRHVDAVVDVLKRASEVKSADELDTSALRDSISALAAMSPSRAASRATTVTITYSDSTGQQLYANGAQSSLYTSTPLAKSSAARLVGAAGVAAVAALLVVAM